MSANESSGQTEVADFDSICTMIQFVIPTDFSPASSVALNYGMALARKLNATVHLVHFVHIETYTHAAAQVHMFKIIELMVKHANQNLNRIADELKQNYKEVKVKTACLQGEYLTTGLNSYVKENGIDLVVMGTRGASGILGNILGSNTSEVIAQATIPVLAVPPGSVYKDHPRILLTTDLQNLEPKLRIIVPLAFILESQITLVHISTDGKYSEKDEEEIRSRLSAEFNLKDLKVKIIRNDSIENGIHDFALANRPCIVAMFTHKLVFFEKLFGKSVTRKAVFHTEVPLLALKQ